MIFLNKCILSALLCLSVVKLNATEKINIAQFVEENLSKKRKKISLSNDGKKVSIPFGSGRIRYADLGFKLIVEVPLLKSLAIVDIASAKIHKYIPVNSKEYSFCAGGNKLVIQYQNTLEVWNLDSYIPKMYKIPSRIKANDISMSRLDDDRVFILQNSYPNVCIFSLDKGGIIEPVKQNKWKGKTGLNLATKRYMDVADHGRDLYITESDGIFEGIHFDVSDRSGILTYKRVKIEAGFRKKIQRRYQISNKGNYEINEIGVLDRVSRKYVWRNSLSKKHLNIKRRLYPIALPRNRVLGDNSFIELDEASHSVRIVSLPSFKIIKTIKLTDSQMNVVSSRGLRVFDVYASVYSKSCVFVGEKAIWLYPLDIELNPRCYRKRQQGDKWMSILAIKDEETVVVESGPRGVAFDAENKQASWKIRGKSGEAEFILFLVTRKDGSKYYITREVLIP